MQIAQNYKNQTTAYHP